jgi:DNA-binding SARP family transcriptional activator
MAIEFRILGELEVAHRGKVCDLGSLRQRSLLARLLIHPGQLLSPERLIEDLSPRPARVRVAATFGSRR